ncbi:MAG: 3,4-dihydroxy-2-butanone-4-phosphate synthase [Deltaproteobacteria bacterium]|nr:MAG: 3,4-dihydroxy-2-butanone-4-phosphate synthase [Deltaproteobacteria bacterium]
MTNRLDHVEACIAAVRDGRMIVLVDDEDRENEGDLVVAAQHCRPEDVNFMCRYGRGLICVALDAERVEALRLPMMVDRGRDDMGTAFTVSIEAREGVTTGISAADRARTIRVAADPACGPDDLVQPGHVFPLRAQPGGVLVRSGHTEGAVDLARMAGLWPAGVICEIMRDDGEMARMPDLERFAREHDLPILTIADLIRYRLERESLVEAVDAVPFASRRLGIAPESGWVLRSFRSTLRPHVYYLALVKGDVAAEGAPVLVRAQRARLVGDVFGWDEDDSAGRLERAVSAIEAEGRGVVLYVVGQGVGDFDGRLQASEAPAPSAAPPRPTDSGFRSFGLGAQVLRALGLSRIVVMTDHPRKIVGVSGYGIDVVGTRPMSEA